jgi:hypothetical protein
MLNQAYGIGKYRFRVLMLNNPVAVIMKNCHRENLTLYTTSRGKAAVGGENGNEGQTGGEKRGLNPSGAMSHLNSLFPRPADRTERQNPAER